MAPLDDADAARRDGLVTPGKRALLAYYRYLHGEKLCLTSLGLHGSLDSGAPLP